MKAGWSVAVTLVVVLAIAWTIFHLPEGKIPTPQLEVHAYDSQGNSLPVQAKLAGIATVPPALSVIPGQNESVNVGNMTVNVPLSTATLSFVIKPTNTGTTKADYMLLELNATNTAGGGWNLECYANQNASNTTYSASNVMPAEQPSFAPLPCTITTMPQGSDQNNSFLIDVLGQDSTSAIRRNYIVTVHKIPAPYTATTLQSATYKQAYAYSSGIVCPGCIADAQTGDPPAKLQTTNTYIEVVNWVAVQGYAETATATTFGVNTGGNGCANSFLKRYAWNGAWNYYQMGGVPMWVTKGLGFAEVTVFSSNGTNCVVPPPPECPGVGGNCVEITYAQASGFCSRIAWKHRVVHTSSCTAFAYDATGYVTYTYW